ncbi:MAG: M3 family peptidase, partial [Parvularculaceae bacterium]|nr:M3 family peptidase [Parvularculaceae bacterium]
MRNLKLFSAGVSALALAACATNSAPDVNSWPKADLIAAAASVDVDPATNVFLAEWTGPYGGVPAFDKIDLTQLKPALEAAIAMNLAEIDAIANNPAPASFENTILALEDSGRAINRVFAYYSVLSGNLSSPEFRAIQQEMAPRLAEYNSKITQNEKLFARVKAVHDSSAVKKMSPDQQRLVQIVYDGFARNGATLDGDAKARYAQINQRLAELHTKFANNVLHDEEFYVTYLTEDQLGGLPPSLIKSAAAAAEARGEKGKYAITNTRSSMDPFLTYSTERDLREKVWRTYYNRGDNGDEYDNNAIITEILQLRDERVALLGYENYASWRLEDRMAKTPARAFDLMMAVWPASVGRVREEVADMQAIADAEGANIKIGPWDYRYYAEKVRAEKYDLNSDEVKQYLELGRLREAMFFVAGELFNFDFTPVAEGSVPVFQEDVKVWEVTDKTSGEHIGLWYLDPFARPGKRS